jgi:hypothetical protein
MSVRTLKQAADNILMTAMPSVVQKQLYLIFKGAVALVQAEALTAEKFAMWADAQKTRVAWPQKLPCILQTGGVVTVEEP